MLRRMTRSQEGAQAREAGGEAPPVREAEREGFEPSTHLSAGTRFPVAFLRPLGHLSGAASVAPEMTQMGHEIAEGGGLRCSRRGRPGRVLSLRPA